MGLYQVLSKTVVGLWTSVSTPGGLKQVGVLRRRLEIANQLVAQSEALIAGWRELAERQQAAGHDTSTSRKLLETFQADLKAALREKEHAERALKRRVRDFFVGAKGRRPETDQELEEWLASREGNAATAFEPMPLSPSAESRHRS